MGSVWEELRAEERDVKHSQRWRRVDRDVSWTEAYRRLVAMETTRGLLRLQVQQLRGQVGRWGRERATGRNIQDVSCGEPVQALNPLKISGDGRFAAPEVWQRPPRGCRLNVLGHYTIMLATSGCRLVVDPVFVPRLGGLPRLGDCAVGGRLIDGERGRTHPDVARRTDGAEALGLSKSLEDVDVVILTSGRPGHLCTRSLEHLPLGCRILGPVSCAPLLSHGPRDFQVLRPGDRRRFGDVVVHVFAAGPNDAIALHLEKVVRPTRQASFFHSGGANFSGLFEHVGKRFRTDLALVGVAPHDAFLARRGCSPLSAIQAARALGASRLWPTGWGVYVAGARSAGATKKSIVWAERMSRRVDLPTPKIWCETQGTVAVD